jgi:inner membrane transporter RhtA
MAATAKAQRRIRSTPSVPVHALVLASISSVQVGAAWATTIFHQVGASGACLLRLAAASVVLVAVGRPDVRSFSRRQWLSACTLGLVLAGMNLTFYHAISRIPLGTAVTIEFIGPLLVALAGSRRLRDLIWALLAAAGIVALCHGIASGTDAAGLILAAIAGLLWAAYILVQAQVGRAFSDGSGLALAMTLAAVVALPLGVGSGSSRLVVPGTLAIGVAVGMLSSAIPYSLELRALRSLSTATFGVLMSLEPAVAALAGALVIGQAITLRDGLGIGLVCVASLGASLTSRTPPEPLSPAA